MFYRIINMVCCLFDNDLLGRRTAIESSDSGRQEFFYDECSNLVRENNSVLRQNNKQIVYKYDGLNRLVYIDYPDTKDTVYTYGEKNDTKGAAGRIRKIEDASGTLEYEYGSLGEVKKETRTLTHHLNDLLEKETAVMSYRSDYLGRMQWIEYPDGERIVYGYDKGGQVISVTGSHWGRKFKYVTDIQYDQYGQRKRIDYGNGTFTEYNYDAKRRWLDTIKTYKADNSGNPLKTYQNITYNFDAVGNVNWYENNCMDNVRGNYKTRQDYTYDNLYQLIKVEGKSKYNPHFGTIPEYEAEYSQTFTFDDNGFGKIMNKKSTESIVPYRKIGDNLKYEFDYEYDVENYTHRRIRAGNLFYKYDDNGNIICEQDGSFDSNDDDGTYHKIQEESDEVYSTDYGWGLFRDDGTDIKGKHIRYKRMYSWNEKNMLVFSEDASHSTSYIYGHDGQRTNKYTRSSETLYFNNMWTLHTDAGNNDYGGQYAKNVYLGETRIVTKLYLKNDPRVDAEEIQQYFYHSDHLGSASLISDYKGDEYQRIEYTPYGETWIERTDNKGVDYLPYRFTGKELDEETGLYYYGARYLDPKYSTWISTDPALGDYIPQAPINDEAKRHNQNLPGMGGIFNTVNLNLYHYAANNPVRYIDPNGRDHGDYDVIDDTVKGFTLAYDVYTKTTLDNFPNIYTKNFENFVNEKPLFWTYAAGAGSLAGGGYALYNSVSWINDLVSIFEYEYRITNNYLLDNGIDVLNQTLFGKDWNSNISYSFDFKGSFISSENIKLKTLSAMSIPINDDTTFSLKLSCCLNFYYSDCKEKTRFDFYKATLCITIKN